MYSMKMARGWMEEGGGLPTDIHMRKKEKEKTDRAGIMVSIYRACRESRKQMRANRKGKVEMFGGVGG